MKRLFFVLATLIVVTFSAYSNDFQWRFYFNGNEITSVLPIFGNSIYLIGSKEAGIGVFNLDSMKYVGIYNKLNTPLPTHQINKLRKQSLDSVWICTPKGILLLTSSGLNLYNTQNSGLPSDNVNDVAFDVLGNKWIATDNGLAFFDGTDWVVYNTGNSGLPSDKINYVTIDRLGNIWLGTDFGLVLFDRNDWYVWNTTNSQLPADFVTFVEFDPNNYSKWVGTLGGGLVNIVGDNFFVFDTNNSNIPSNNVLSIAWDTSNYKWIGTDSGIWYQNANGWNVLTADSSDLSNDYIYQIHIDRITNRKFVCTKNMLNVIQDTNFIHIDFKNSPLPSNEIVTLFEHYDLRKFISSKYGLNTFDGLNWGNLNFLIQFDDVVVNDIEFYKPRNIISFATNYGLTLGFFISNFPPIFYILTYDTLGLPSNNVRKLLQDGSKLWVGTDSGLVSLDLSQQNFSQVTRYDTLYDGVLRNDITALYKSGDSLYIGLNRVGLAILTPDTLYLYDVNNSPLVGVTINDIYIDDNQTLMLATDRVGLVTFDSVWNIYGDGNSPLPSNNLTRIAMDKQGWLWIGTFDAGLVAIKDTNWIYLNNANSPLESNYIADILVDISNNKWIATNKGLYVLNDIILPEIRTYELPYSLCQGTNTVVRFYTFGLFDSQNEFLALLSDSSGSFDNPMIIGRSRASSANQIQNQILCYVPKGIKESLHYRIKVVSTQPALDGGDLNRNIEIHDIEKPAIYGDSIVCSSSEQILWRDSKPNHLYIWRVEGGVILNDPMSDTIFVEWETNTEGKVVLTSVNQYNCVDSSILLVHFSNLPGRILNGPKLACSGNTYLYSTSDSTEILNSWSVVNGTLITKPRHNVVLIRWDSVGQGFVRLRRTTIGGCTDTVSIKVDIFEKPVANITGPGEVRIEDVVIYKTRRNSSFFGVQWKVTNGAIIGESNRDSVTIAWIYPGVGKVSVVQTSQAGCFDSTEIMVRIFQPAEILGDTLVCEQTETYFESISNLGANCLWSVQGGTITSSNTNRRIWVLWGQSGIGKVRLIQNFPGYNFRDTAEITVRIAPKPEKPVIIDSGGFLASSSLYGNQWYYNGVILIGDTNQYIYPQRTGYYTVQVTTAPGCVSEMSDPFYFVSSVIENLEGIRIYPNPATSKLFITSTEGWQIRRICLKDNLGNTLMEVSQGATESIDLDVSSVPSGVYLLEIVSGGIRQVAKVIIIH